MLVGIYLNANNWAIKTQMTGHSCTLTEKGITLKEKNSSQKQKSQKGRGGTQAQSTASSHKKQAVETSSSSSNDDDHPHKWCCQPDPEEIEINNGFDDAEGVEVIDGSDMVDKGDDEHGNGNDSDVEMLDSMVSHVDFQRKAGSHHELEQRFKRQAPCCYSNIT